MTTTIYTDGGSRGNPGKAACAFIAVKDNKIIKQQSKYLGIATNNEAEYNAVILALENILEKDITIISDSQLVVNQIQGNWKINKEHLELLNQKVQGLISNRNVKLKNDSRENKFISLADNLVNQELDINK